jgi:glucose-6-phosphate isomerase
MEVSMVLSLEEKYLGGYVSAEQMQEIEGETLAAYDKLVTKTGLGADFLGWVDLPVDYDKEEFERIQAAAERIRNSCDILVVLGIGGSYLGARAAIEFVKSPNYNALCKDTPQIYFAGRDISTTALNELLQICEGKELCVNVISKSGTTTEPAIAFRVFKELMVKKYGEDGARSRIFATTDKARGTLKSYADSCGFETFVVPDDVGGRFSVLTAVGLLPIAVAGVDIVALMQGAADARKALMTRDFNTNAAMRYAAIRNILYRSGKNIEITVGYEPFMLMINEWWKQLYGESEGKDQKGIFPASLIFSTDLHSLGQYVQEGKRTMFETVLCVEDTGAEYIISEDKQNVDGLNFLAGKPLDFVNKQAMIATLLAHCDGGVPNILLTLKDRSAHSLGYLFYFYEFACAISGYILGVNPFNQPGVESYKKNMFALLGKPGYEELRLELKKRLN